MENSSIMRTGNFIHAYIKQDLGENTNKIHTRFPPEPNGYLHIGHAKSIILNYSLAKEYGGKFNLRFDDTNPLKEDTEFVESIKADIQWLGCDWEDRLFFASDYFEIFYNCAIELIKKGLAFVCELTADQIREYRGSLNEPGKHSPYRERSIEENLDLFERMRAGEFPDGSKTLRAKIDMSSPNVNMRDPVIYRIAKVHHHNTGDAWCIYPMYDYAHPLEDAIEGITHSICTLEFEDHRALYDWFIDNLNVGDSSALRSKPRQIEFAKLILPNSPMGKRYLRQLVEEGKLEGWDDPRIVTLQGLRRRGILPSAIKSFVESVGVSKADSVIDLAQFDYYIREDLKPIAKNVMAVVEPLKVTITNYPENEVEMLEVENSQENENLGTRQVSFGREIYIEREDFMLDAPNKFHRLTIGKEVRLKGAYFIKAEEVVYDENGEIIEVLCTYDPLTKSGMTVERKVKGTIQWVNAKEYVKATLRYFETLVKEENGEQVENENSLVTYDALIEKSVLDNDLDTRFQFMRNGYFCFDSKLSSKENPVFNRIVSLKSSYKPTN